MLGRFDAVRQLHGDMHGMDPMHYKANMSD